MIYTKIKYYQPTDSEGYLPPCVFMKGGGSNKQSINPTPESTVFHLFTLLAAWDRKRLNTDSISCFVGPAAAPELLILLPVVDRTDDFAKMYCF